MTNYLVIGDIAGRYDELMLLLNKMPEGHIIQVGDLIDRGDQSKEVYEFFRTRVEDGRATVIQGNHESMLYNDVFELGFYGHGIWDYNGGYKTKESFGFDQEKLKEVSRWCRSLPFYKKIIIKDKEIVISHSFIDARMNLEEACDIAKNPAKYSRDLYYYNSIVWNRDYPKKRDFLQIAGHNANWGLRWFEDKDDSYAICIDDSGKKKLTGLHLKDDGTWDVFQQDYLKKEREK